MPETRPTIPASLERDLMIESGYRCALCGAVDPLEIEHIEDYATVKEHVFVNMIVLCANCHRRKKDTSNPRHINKISLKKIKENLMILNGRYSDLEKRIIDEFKEAVSRGNNIGVLYVNSYLHLLIKNLIKDGFVNVVIYESTLTESYGDGTVIRNNMLKLSLTIDGLSFIKKLIDAREGSL